MNDEQVTRALRALAEHDRAEEAPAFVEARVLAAFRERRKRAVWPRVWKMTVGFAAAAAIVAMVALWPREQVAAPVVRAPAPRIVEQPPPDIFVEVPPQPARRALPRAVASAPAPREVVTEFFPLMDVMPPIERGQVYRVSVPASTMRVAGVPVSREMWNQRVEAEVLVGEEGLARAIRFVGYEQ